MNNHSSRFRARALLSMMAVCSLPVSVLADGLCDGLSNVECKSIASRSVYALLSNNYIATLYGSNMVKQAQVARIDGNLIGIDFRPAALNPQPPHDSPRGLYGLTDTGKIYALSISNDLGTIGVGATLVSSLTQPFDGGFQSLLDFNPVADALRLIGSNDQNFAVVNSGGDFNLTVPQAAIAYAAGDPQAGKDPNLTAGAYTNNVAGATTTVFYALDFASDSLVTIAGGTNGSPVTGGGQIKTIGKLIDPAGKPINITPEAGIDIYTDSVIGNAALISSGTALYFINLATVNPNLPVGRTQNVVAKPLPRGRELAQPLTTTGVFIDIASTPSPVLTTVTDLALTRGDSPPSFIEGRPYTFELIVSNQGPDSQAATRLTASVFAFKDPVITASQGACTLDPLTRSGRTFVCNLGTLASNGKATVRITVTRAVDASPTDRLRLLPVAFFVEDPAASAIGIPNDPDRSNNTAQVSVIQNL